MNEKKKSIDRQIIRYFWNASKSTTKVYYLSWLIPVQAVLSNTVAPFIVGKILASLLVPHSSVRGLIVAFILTAFASYITNWLGFWGFMKAQALSITKLHAEVLSMLLKRGTSFHNNQVSGKLVAEAMDFPSAYMQLATTFFTSIVPFTVALISGIAVIAYSSPILGVLVLVMTIMAIGSGFYQRIKMAPFRNERITLQKEVTSHFADTVVNIQAVKTFAHEADELAVHGQKSGRLEAVRVDNWIRWSRGGTQRIGALFIFQLVFILTVVALVHRNPALLGAGIFAFSYTVVLANRLFDVGTILRSVEEALIQAEPMMRAMLENPEVQDEPHASDLVANEGAISFKNIGFHYSDGSGNANVFSDLNLDIPAGQKVGLVGPSGGGKSTITRLLLRFEDVQAGAIEIDGQDISNVKQASLRQAIAYVPQESLLFHRTIAENIAYGNLDATEDMVIQAAKDAYAHDFIMELPKGYETVVGERGVKLSGGQRQRIAIARAMLKNAPILLLDEATSALDSESEKVIQEALAELMEKRTAVVIAHRLSTIQRMDRIVVLDKGKIVEDGTHKELLKNDGLYARLWAHQSGGFIEV